MRVNVVSENLKVFSKNDSGSDGNIRVIQENMEEKRDGEFYAFFTRNVVYNNLEYSM